MNYLVIGNKTEDHITFADGTTKVSPGGPVKFIRDYLVSKSQNVKCRSSNKPTIVKFSEIDNDQTPRVYDHQPISDCSVKNSDLIIISTVLDEINLRSIQLFKNNFGGIIALDMQGYLRKINADNTISRVRNNSQPDLDIVKLNEDEMNIQFDGGISELREFSSDKKGIYLVTSSLGLKVVKTGSVSDYRVQTKDFQNTVGAGDTLLASFCHHFNQTNNIDVSADSALKDTFNFLAKQNEY